MSRNDRPTLAYSGEPRSDAQAAVELTPGADAARGRGGRTAKTARTVRVPASASCPAGRVRRNELSAGWER
ncbi:hypothetical protein [Methylobacterium fujisawaense]